MTITFDSAGVPVVGELHLPSSPAAHGAVVLLGPLTSVKEQVTGRYAEAFARRGWAALSFDPRHFGESGGEPRQYESPAAKAGDVSAAVTWLSERAEIDADRIVGVGVCAGGGYMAAAVAQDPRLRAFGAVAGFFHDNGKQRQWMGAGYEAALEKAIEARRVYEETGEATTIPAVAREGERAMPLDEAFTYYGTERGGSLGHYVNAFATMSREQTLPFDAQSVATDIRVPTVLVHSESALAPALARSFFERLTVPKSMAWLESEGQIDFYDDERCIEPAADLLVAHFDEHVG